MTGFRALQFRRFLSFHGRGFLGCAYMYGSGWTSGFTCRDSPLPKPMNAQVAKDQFVILELWGPVGTDLEARPAALAFIFVDQGHAGLDIIEDGRLWASWNTWRIRTVHA